MSNMMNIGLSGVMAAQFQLSVTAQNTANSSTDGYSRIRGNTAAVSMQSGGGVRVLGTQRMTDPFLVKQHQQAYSDYKGSYAYASYMMTVEGIFSTDGGNLSTGMDNLFGALTQGMVEPDNEAYRTDILNQFISMTNQINTVYSSTQSQLEQTNSGLQGQVLAINSLSKEVAGLNAQIADGLARGQDVNGLLDQRDAVLTELGGCIEIKVVDNPDGTVNVTLPRGQPLVLSTTAAELTFEQSADPANSNLQITLGDETYAVEQGGLGGTIGAMYTYYHQDLLPALEFIDEFAVTFADEFNAVNQQGFTPDGTPGEPIFTYDPARPAASLSIAPDFTHQMLAFSSDPAKPGDNTNLQAMIDIKDKEFTFLSLDANATYTLHTAFSALYSNVSSRTATARAEADKDTQVANNAEMALKSLTSVDMNEEAANLMLYQKNYQANAKVLMVSGTLIDSMLSMF